MYEYECDEHGRFEALRPLGSAAEPIDCPRCGTLATRVMSAPRIVTRGHGAWTAALDHAQKSRHEPEVVTSLPRAGMVRPGPVGTITPAMRHLPRP
ncbi:FmdB family zinc ribbon protein [Pseudorhodoferax sp.]|uniref:FmdB family zinc ribbon protein n=1 Tax=Pseudorhodoferax sp. TaxID=1993553 RepID=UPI002DD63B02|nr:zinc ribbon domain-containing protein [Pseudorhodoferax sp.]